MALHKMEISVGRLTFLLVLMFSLSACQGECEAGYYSSDCLACGHCLNGVQCDHVSGRCELGCQPGYSMPLCNSNCGSGTYGKNCERRCGQCANGAVCDMISGACPAGRCDKWYVGNNSLCDVFIAQINIHTIPQVVYVKDDWARLDLAVHLHKQAIPHYRFTTEYISDRRPHAQFTQYTDTEALYDARSEKLMLTVKGLEPDTQYWFRARISRSHDGHSEEGTPSDEVKVTTQTVSSNARVCDPVAIGTLIILLFTFIIIAGIAIWIAYQCFSQSHPLAVNGSLGVNNFHSSHSEGDTSKVAFNL